MRITTITLIGSALLSLLVIAVCAAAPSASASANVGVTCPPPGTCSKAFTLCQRGDEVPWCDIMFKCLDCQIDPFDSTPSHD